MPPTQLQQQERNARLPSCNLLLGGWIGSVGHLERHAVGITQSIERPDRMFANVAANAAANNKPGRTDAGWADKPRVWKMLAAATPCASIARFFLAHAA